MTFGEYVIYSIGWIFMVLLFLVFGMAFWEGFTRMFEERKARKFEEYKARILKEADREKAR